jgi:hypothetical protein
MKRLRNSLAIILCCVLMMSVASCGSTEPETRDALAGTWKLTSVNGQAPPTFYGGATINGETLLLPGDGTFIRYISRNVGTPSAPQEQSYTEEGTYVVTGGAITFTRTVSGVTRDGTFTNTTITLVTGGTYVYTRN